MKERTIEILLLFGIVFVSVGIVIWFARKYMKKDSADTEKWMEAFQGVAKGGAAPVYRGDYNRSPSLKETRAQNQYQQPRYTQDLKTVGNPLVKHIRIEGKNELLHISRIAVYVPNLFAGEKGLNIAPQGTVSSSGDHEECHHSPHHGCSGFMCLGQGQWGCHYRSASNVKQTWLAMGTGYDMFHSNSSTNPWIELTLDGNDNDVKSVEIWNRGDCCQDRLAGFKLSLYSSSRQLIHQFTLTSANTQLYEIPAPTQCPAGYRLNTSILSTRSVTCRQNCQPGETADNNIAICYKPCNSGDYLDGGAGGTCKTPCPAGFTLSENTCYKNCILPEIEMDIKNCYKACAAGEDDTRPPKCHKPCPSGYRLIDSRYDSNIKDCFPNDPYTYLPIAWFGPILSQAETTRNMGLTQSIGKQNGAAVGLWGSISESASSTNYATDQLWAYTEDMELICMETRKCMDAGGEAPCMWDCHKGENQKWVIDSEGRIRPKQNMSKCLTAVDWTARPTGDPIVQLTANKKVSLQDCTNDGNKFQRWKIPAARVGLNQAVGSAAAPPALPAEPLNRDGFTDGGDSKSSLAKRTTDDAF